MSELINLQGTIFLLVAVGVLMRKMNIVTKEGQKSITDLVINLILPCNIVKAFCMDFTGQMGVELVAVFVISAGIQVLAVIYGKVMFNKETEARKKCLRYGTICSNAGFLGNPIAEGVYGPYGLLLASVFLIPVRTMMWSEGIAIFSGTTDVKATMKKVATHPCILACGIGILMMLTGFRFPTVMDKTISYIGGCNTAMSMLIIGMILSNMNLRMMMDKTAWIYCLHRLVILPLIVYIVTGFLPVAPLVRGLVVLLTAMPAGATTSILAAKYEMEPEFATKLVIISTLLSLPTLSVWSMILA